jgi:hypothetical protein
MSWINLSIESEVAADEAYVGARQAAFEGRDHTEALKKLDAALHELRTIEMMVRFLAPILGCEPKDVWETLNIIDKRRENPWRAMYEAEECRNPFIKVAATGNDPSILS